jgi:integrase
MARRVKIAPGIWREGDRLIGEARIGSSRDGKQGREQKPFPLGTDLAKIRSWIHATKAALEVARPETAPRGTLAADIAIYLKTLPTGQYKADSTAIFAHWIASPLGAMPRADIDRLDVIAQISRWLETGAAVNTTNKRLSRLRQLFQALDGINTPNPTDKITFLREPESAPRDIPVYIVKLILNSLPDVGRADRGGERPDTSETKIRLRVMAYTGIAPATLRRVSARDLDLDNGRIYLTARRKGKGAPGAWVSLIPPAVDALRAFAAAKLFGRAWSRSSMRKTWLVGIKRAKVTAAAYAERTGDPSWVTGLANLPPRCKPYDLRHSFASEIYRVTGDIRAVSELLQHADLETTKRYTKGAVSERVTAAIAKAGEVYTGSRELPSSPAAAKKQKRMIGIVRAS